MTARILNHTQSTSIIKRQHLILATRLANLEESIAGIQFKHHASNAPNVARLRPTYICITHRQETNGIRYTAASRAMVKFKPIWIQNETH